jgi:hypothetical protein
LITSKGLKKLPFYLSNRYLPHGLGGICRLVLAATDTYHFSSHLLVVENDDRNRPLGIIPATDFVAYLKENLNIDDANAKIFQANHCSQNETLAVL